MNSISLVVPTISSEIDSFLSLSYFLFNNLPINNIYLICNTNSKTICSNNPKIKFIDESKLINYSIIKDLLISRIDNDDIGKRTGWYLQQFLKMSFSRICKDEYYLLWDSDTVPLKPIRLFNEAGIPFLDYKSEFHQPYFETLSRILPNCKKEFQGSFISEHMLIKTSHMRELLDEIERNSSLPGSLFYEKIINAIPVKHLTLSGYSEFETYGTFVIKKYPQKYILRKWHSLRYGGFFFLKEDLQDILIRTWLSRTYDAITFERTHFISSLRYLSRNKIFRKIAKASILEYISIPIRASQKIYRLLCIGKRKI